MKKSVSGPTRQDQPPVVSVASNERALVMERKVVRGLADSGIMPPMKYWEIVADKLSAAGWSWGHCSAVTRDGWRWIVDAHRKGRRYIVILTNCWTHSLNWKQCCCDCSSWMHLALWRDGSDARQQPIQPTALYVLGVTKTPPTSGGSDAAFMLASLSGS